MNKYTEVEVGDQTYKVEYSAFAWWKAKDKHGISFKLSELNDLGQLDVGDMFDFMFVGVVHHQPDIDREEFFKSVGFEDFETFFAHFDNATSNGEEGNE